MIDLSNSSSTTYMTTSTTTMITAITSFCVNVANTLSASPTAKAAVIVVFCISAISGMLLTKKSILPADCDSKSAKVSYKNKESLIKNTKAVEKKSKDKTKNRNINEATENNTERILTPGRITIAYASTTGTCSKMAHKLHDRLLETLSSTKANDQEPTQKFQIQTIHKFDWWDELLNNENNSKTNNQQQQQPPILILLLPTWTNGTLPPPVANNRTLSETFPNLLDSLHEITTDWRIPKKALSTSNLTLTVFGLGSSEYDPKTFCKPAKDIHRLLIGKLGAKRLLQSNDEVKVTTATSSSTNATRRGGKRNWNLTMGDESVGDVEATIFQEWMDKVVNEVSNIYGIVSNSCNKQEHDDEKEGSCDCAKKSGKEHDSSPCCQSSTKEDDFTFLSDDDEHIDDDDDDDEDENEPDIMDMEDMGNAIKHKSKKSLSSIANSSEPPEMITPKQAVALKKEGYKLIGTHSAVKLCRWTKHQLRGRGGCYKHTFYGITSYQCMEATPSLACANKCVFCWRHHKNPVGTTWKWKTDDPFQIVSDAVTTHVKMIKETKGIPGVLPSRWKEAHTVRHCALSLVGEPIMYPRINELLGELHRRKISTFLVTNGQHPEAIQTLRPVTQLYVSVDAPTPESLDAIDRPLFKDAWQRLRKSLKCLKEKGQRTVARLTVVKGWNSDEIGGYAELIALGHCSLVEIKGVTFCGKSDASNLNMTNTPWHHEVVNLAAALQKELATMTAKGGSNAPPLYGIACEHKHSCSVLLARVDQFSTTDSITDKTSWKTWIDYDKFHELAEKHRINPSFQFSVDDYVADTPDWAISGAEEEGFDPTDTRHYRKKKLYTDFDENGVPTHDKDGRVIEEGERNRLKAVMEKKREEIGESDGNVKAGVSGEKEVIDVSLMFRGMVVEKR